jgi:hypothetical protein
MMDFEDRVVVFVLIKLKHEVKIYTLFQTKGCKARLFEL